MEVKCACYKKNYSLGNLGRLPSFVIDNHNTFGQCEDLNDLNVEDHFYELL
jgi:hypothetical protein